MPPTSGEHKEEAPSEKEEQPSATSDASLLSLHQFYLYQNGQTGQASSTPLSIVQLCRLLCPLAATAHRFLTGDTQLLGVVDGTTYSPDGWKLAQSLPILRQAVADWYYEVSTSTTTEKTTPGPVSCRQLAALYHQNQVTDATRVYTSSAALTVEWTRIDALPELQAALQALAPEEAPPQTSASEATTQDSSVVDQKDEVEKELQAFLQTRTARDHPADDEYYESDGGRHYVKDPKTGDWVIPTTTTQQQQQNGGSATRKEAEKKRQSDEGGDSIAAAAPKPKKKKAKFSAKKAQCWVYATGFPVDTTEDEVAQHFAKAGILDIHPETQRPKIKLYRYTSNGEQPGECKGDASICYARPESVELAVTLLDESGFRPDTNGGSSPGYRLHVERAHFQQHGREYDESKSLQKVSAQQRKVAKLATQQAMDWDDGEFNGRLTGGRKGLHIIVLKHMFPAPLTDDSQLEALERDVRTECEERFGVVEKITIFAKHLDGVVIVKFTLPGAASEAVKELHGRFWKQQENGDQGLEGERQRVHASFWDGVTDYTVRDEVQEAKETVQRHKEFGDWLDRQEELPEELQLKTADS